MNRLILALAILALAILSCTVQPPTLPTRLPTQKPTALAIPTRTVTPLPTQKPTALAMVTAARSLHVRARPGEQSVVLGYLYHGNQVELTGKCSEDPLGWAQIHWKHSVAWVNSKFLSESNCQTSKEGE